MKYNKQNKISKSGLSLHFNKLTYFDVKDLKDAPEPAGIIKTNNENLSYKPVTSFYKPISLL